MEYESLIMRAKALRFMQKYYISNAFKDSRYLNKSNSCAKQAQELENAAHRLAQQGFALI